jgi:hypothetical protein
MMTKSIFNLLIVVSIVVMDINCSPRIMEAMEPHKFQDNWFILRRNGHYSYKLLFLGVFRSPDVQRGRYMRSNDTIYLISRKRKNIMQYYGIGIIDSVAGIFRYHYNDSTEWKEMEIREMPTRKRDKQSQK